MSNLSIKERKSNFNGLNKLIKGDIQYMVGYINKDKKLKTKPVGSSNKNKCMAYCGELLFGILSYCKYIDLEKMKIVSGKIEKEEYRLLGTK